MDEQNLILKALGLVTAYNTLDVPSGTFSTASNVIIRKQGVVEQRRGFALYGTNLGGNAKQLLTYQNRILRHFGTKLDFDSDGNGDFTQFSGNYLEPETGIRIKSSEYAGNLFFTSSEGIKKISASSTQDLINNGANANYIKNAGGLKSLDMQATLQTTLGNSTSWFLNDSAVAYRSVLTYIDANNISVAGAVSQRIDVYNYLINRIQQDYNNLLLALDNIVRTDATSRLGPTDNYMSDTTSGQLQFTDSAIITRNHIIALGTKLDDRIIIAENGGTPQLTTRQRTSSTSADLIFNTSMVTYVTTNDRLIAPSYTGVGSTDFNNNILTVIDVSGTTITVTPSTDFTATDGAPIADITPTIKRSKYSNEELYPQPAVPSATATDAQLQAIHDYLGDFLLGLQSELTGIISSGSQSTYLTPLALTETSTVLIEVTLPEEATTDYFIQLYRSKSLSGQATDTTVLANTSPLDELQLAYEAYLTDDDITNGYVIIEDITPDSLLGANLYTNEFSGEGILQNNDVPPVATDINLFKNYTFYSNTRTKHNKILTLVGVSRMIEDYNSMITPKLLITNSNNETNTYSFILGVAQVIQVTAVADVADSLNGTYFLLNSGEDQNLYYVWYKTSGGIATDPSISGRTGIRVNIDTGDTAAEVARKTASTLFAYNQDFIISGTSNPFNITATQDGYTTNPGAGTSGFTITTTTSGTGENITSKQILLSSAVSPAQAIDETARSLVRVVNRNDNESVYAYYLFDPTQPPGKIAFEARTLNDYSFYFLGNNSNTGRSFVPELTPLYSGSSLVTLTTANGTPTITTSAAHGLNNGDTVLLVNTQTALIDGYWEVSNITPTTFDITTNASATTSTGSLLDTDNAVISSDDNKPNRMYYSKLQQPEAVPILNYIDVGAGNKAILRIMPLNDNLFVFKEDGIYRITGETAPFNIVLHDPSSILIVPDTVSLLNSFIYYWSRQGINRLSQGGTELVSKPIDNIIKQYSSSEYPNFQTATWGLGYESDNTYYLGLVQNPADTKAQITYKFCTLTDSWVTSDIVSTCGIIHPTEDIMYAGSSDTNYIEKERKSFSRTDYADREYIFALTSNKYDIYAKTIELINLNNVSIGDVVVQEQGVTLYLFNQLLKQLDTDPLIPSTDYFSTLECRPGDNVRTKLLSLATKLDGELTSGYSTSIQSLTNVSITDISEGTQALLTSVGHGLQNNRIITITGSTSTPNIDGTYEVTVIDADTIQIDVEVTNGSTMAPGVCTFNTEDNDIRDLRACYNSLINLLNSDPLTTFHNYPPISYYTVLETLITDLNLITNKINISQALNFLQGNITIYEAINSNIIYNPITFGDPINLKHLREIQLLFINKAFTKGTIGFKSDLIPLMMQLDFPGEGNGIFGLSGNFGSGFFGGNSRGTPFRTYIPREYHRCRYLQIQFKHTIARESYTFFGATFTGNLGLKERAYRS